MHSLYLTLLAATLTLFGIMAAILFFYTNQLTAKYSIRNLSFLLKDIRTALFFLVGIITIVLSTLGAFTLLYTYSLFHFYDFNIAPLVPTPLYPVVVILSFFILIILFIVFTYRYSRYPNAQLIVRKVLNRIKPEDLKRYVFYFYDLPEPTEGDFLTPELKQLLFRQKLTREKLTEEQEKEYEKGVANFKSALKEFNDFKKEINELSKNCKINDPFSIIVDMSAKALNNHDLITWRLIHDELVKFIDVWLKNEVLEEFETHKSVRQQSWVPYFYLSKLLVQHLSFMKEVVNKSGHPSLLHDVVSTSKHLANSFAIYGHNWDSVLEITSFMKKLGKELIDDGRIDELHPIFDSFGELGEQSIKQKNQESFDEICRSFGWLGEHLVMRGIPVGPLMPNYDATGELDSLINCIDKIKNALLKEKLEIFSQTYYSAIEAITLKFIEKGNEKQTFESPLISIIQCIAGCGEEAAKLGISSIVSHSVYWLREIYERTKNIKWFKELPQDIVSWMAEIGALSACYNRPITDSRVASILFFRPTTGKQDLIEIVIQEMGNINDEKRITNAMHNIYGKYPGEDCYKAVWEFITRMGNVCRSNFGFVFDWETGETYPANDPRRK
jgi:hypothetical protein